jgi:hypothetical protein
VNAVHPETKADLGYLKQFVVTADSGASATPLCFSGDSHLHRREAERQQRQVLDAEGDCEGWRGCGCFGYHG